VCGLTDDTIARLAELPRIIGLKDATGDVTRPLRLRSLLGAEFRLLSGDDASALGFLAMGGDGCISVTSNVAPALCRAMYLASRKGQMAQVLRLAAVAASLTAALSSESNPAPLKYALSQMNLMSPRVRLPLVELKAEGKARIDAVLSQTCAGHPGYLITSVAGQDPDIVVSVNKTARPGSKPRPRLVIAS
jgi:4-hydroxy-tetrahydrodipicolinate synthase